MADPRSDPLVIPLGHYLGPVHRRRGEPAEVHRVRVGWRAHSLAVGAELDVWSLAHGLPDLVGVQPWTRLLLDSMACDAGMDETSDVVDRLAERGLVALVPLDEEGITRFAQAHRLQQLMTGLGDVPGDDSVDGIGLLGAPPVLTVHPIVFETWGWAHMWPDLEQAASGLARAAASDPSAPWEETDPGAVLRRITLDLHHLLCRHAAYIDLVRYLPGGTNS